MIGADCSDADIQTIPERYAPGRPGRSARTLQPALPLVGPRAGRGGGLDLRATPADGSEPEDNRRRGRLAALHCPPGPAAVAEASFYQDDVDLDRRFWE